MFCIELKNINKSYGEHIIFQNFNMCVEKGDFTAITGKSGAGKSTLLNIIGLLEKQDSGDVIINGVKNPDFDSNSGRKILRNSIGYLFQNYGLVENETVCYNLRISSGLKNWSKKQEKQKFPEILQKVGFDNPTDIVSKKIFQLSGGEQQRIAVARLMIKEPEIVLADEPTGSLDSETKNIVMNLLKDMNSTGTTIILVTHDEEVRQCAKKSLTL